MMFIYSPYPIHPPLQCLRVFGTRSIFFLAFVAILGLFACINHTTSVKRMEAASRLIQSEDNPLLDDVPPFSSNLPPDASVPQEFLLRQPTLKYINYLDVVPPKYLSDYKNPCWVEKRSPKSPYSLSYYYKVPNRHQNFLKKLDREWDEHQGNSSIWRMRCLPYFYIAGMPKSGSTDLYYKLILHPRIHSGHLKEVHWWTERRATPSNTGDGRQRYVPISNYADIFDEAAQFVGTHGQQNSTSGVVEHPVIFGDGSPSTFWQNKGWKKLPENTGDEPSYHVGDYIRHVTPQARIIAIFREPVSRLYSDYIYFNGLGRSPETFHQKALLAIQAFEKCLVHNSLWGCMNNDTLEDQKLVRLRLGIYAPHIEAWMSSFPRKQLFFGRLDDFMSDQVGFLNDICQFLGLEPFSEELAQYLFIIKQSNARNMKKSETGPMLNETRVMLTNFYAHYNDQMATLLGDEKYLWKS